MSKVLEEITRLENTIPLLVKQIHYVSGEVKREMIDTLKEKSRRYYQLTGNYYQSWRFE